MYNRLYSNDRSHERRKDVKDMVADPYQVLGVSHSATEDEIRQAYRRLAKKYHPDLNPGDAQAAQKMNEVNEAYDLLKNPQAYQQQRAQQQARQAYQQQRQQGYYDPLDPFGFYRSQDGEQNRGSQQSYRTYYYYSTGADGNEDSQPYQWYYQRSTRRSPFGLLGKIIAIFFILDIFFTLFGGCAYRASPYSRYQSGGSSYSEPYGRTGPYSGWNGSTYSENSASTQS